MKIRYRLCSGSDDIVVCNLSASDIALLPLCTSASMLHEHARPRVRAGFLETEHGKVYGVTDDPDLIRSSKAFRNALELLAATLKSYFALAAEYREKANADTNRLMHNLITLNAHNIQEIYSVIPQDFLARLKPGQQLKHVERIVKAESAEVASALLRVAKNNAAMKAEFSVFKKLFETSPRLEKKTHNVHKVLLNILYLFFPDFTDKEVTVVIDCENIVSAFFDYESIHVALYHQIGNAVKYIKPKSNLSIRIEQGVVDATIIFLMESLPIAAGEEEAIFGEGYSGEIAKKVGVAGSGIGMTIARRILKLNQGSISVVCDSSTLHQYMSVPYQTNVFRLVLPAHDTAGESG